MGELMANTHHQLSHMAIDEYGPANRRLACWRCMRNGPFGTGQRQVIRSLYYITYLLVFGDHADWLMQNFIVLSDVAQSW
jgi:hypothetical protein